MSKKVRMISSDNSKDPNSAADGINSNNNNNDGENK